MHTTPQKLMNPHIHPSHSSLPTATKAPHIPQRSIIAYPTPQTLMKPLPQLASHSNQSTPHPTAINDRLPRSPRNNELQVHTDSPPTARLPQQSRHPHPTAINDRFFLLESYLTTIAPSQQRSSAEAFLFGRAQVGWTGVAGRSLGDGGVGRW